MASEIRIYVHRKDILIHIGPSNEKTSLDDLKNDEERRESFCISHPDLVHYLNIIRGLKDDGITKFRYGSDLVDEAEERLKEALGNVKTSGGNWYVYKGEKEGKGFLSSIPNGFTELEVGRFPSPVTIYSEGGEGPQRTVMKWICKNYDPDLYAYGKCNECGKKCVGKVICGIAFCNRGHRMESKDFEGTRSKVDEHVARIKHGDIIESKNDGRKKKATVKFKISESESYSTKDDDVRQLHQRVYEENKIDMLFKKDSEGNYAPSNPYRTYMENIPEDSVYSKIGFKLDRLCRDLYKSGMSLDLFFYIFLIDNGLADRGYPLIYRMCGREVTIKNTEDFIGALFSEPDEVAGRLYKDFESIKDTGLLKTKGGDRYEDETTIPYIIYEWTGRFSYRDDSGRMVDFGTRYFDHIHQRDNMYEERYHMLNDIIASEPQFAEAVCSAYGIDEETLEDVEFENNYERMFLWGFLASKSKRIQYKSLDISNGESGITEIERIVVDAYTDPSEGNRQRYTDLCELSRRKELCDLFSDLKGTIHLYDSKGNVLLSISNIMGYIDGKSRSDRGGIPNIDLYFTCASLLGGNRMDIRFAYGGRVCKLSDHMSAIFRSGSDIDNVMAFLKDPAVESAERHIMSMFGPDALNELREKANGDLDGMVDRISKLNKSFDEKINENIRVS